MFKPIKAEEGKRLEDAVDISSYGPRPYDKFSPFTYSPDFRIPVPGQNGLYSNSVESIWQGLKIINGISDFNLFSRKPKKRRGQVQGHLYGNDILSIVDARLNIYRPAYSYYLDNYVDEEIKDSLLMKVFDKWEVYFYDVEDNLDLENPEPLAHSVFASEYMNDYLNKKLEKIREEIDLFYDTIPPEQTIAEPLSRAINSFKNSSEFNRKLALHFLRSNKQVRDIYYARYYVELFEKLEGQERLQI